MNILQTMRDPALFARWFRDPATWANWCVFLSVLFGLSLDTGAMEVFRQCTGRTTLPVGGFREAWLCVGRRGGKSLTLALIAVFLAVFKDWSGRLVPGERGTILIIAADRRQARTIYRYLTAMIVETPAIAALVDGEVTQDRIDLTNGISIEISTANFRSVRGYTLIACLADEIAFWMGDDSANPDVEILAAIRPAMTTMLPDAMLLCASSPYAQRGALYDAFRRHFGRDDAAVLVWKASTKTMNPSVPQSVIDEAYERDPANAAAEYGAEFRTDVESFVSREAVEACVVTGRYELPPMGGVVYSAFCDAAGGSGTDSMTLCLSHRGDGERVVVDVIREVKPPFSPEGVVQDFARLLKAYRVTSVTADRYAGAWVAERFRVHGIECVQAAKPKSDIYRDLLPILNSGGVELLDHAKAIAQICALERRTARGGRDSIDHPPAGHDDLSNVIAGAVVGTAIAKGGAEGWIEYYRRLSVGHLSTDFDSIRAPGPEFGFSLAAEPLVSVIVPEPIASGGFVRASHGGTEYGTRRLGSQVIAEMRSDDAREILRNPSWRSLNLALARELVGAEEASPSVRISDGTQTQKDDLSREGPN
jgi:hypothetical protein